MATIAWNDLAINTRGTRETRGTENDVNGMRSVERKKLGQGIGSKWGLLLKENTLFSDTQL